MRCNAGGSSLGITSLIVGMFGPGTVTVSGGSVTTSGGDGVVVGNGGTSSLLVDNGGYLALFGDQRSTAGSYITGGEVQTWSGTDWVVNTAFGGFSLTYYETDGAAESFTGYSGLGGYTILTDVQPVPEPGSNLALLALGAGGLTLRRRLKRAA